MPPTSTGYHRGPKAKCWTFKFTSYPENVEELLVAKKNDFNYLVAGRDENKAQNFKWLNGFVVFKCQKRQHQVLKVLDVDHRERDERLIITVANKSFHQNRRYCVRTSNFFEIGHDDRLAALKDDNNDTILKNISTSPVMDMLQRRKQGATEECMVEEFGDSWLANHHRIDASIKRDRQELAEIQLHEKFEKLQLRPWQNKVMSLLRGQGPRIITFVVDENGNSGKTYLGKYIMATKQALYLTSTAMKDVAYAWKGERYIVFDFTRESAERINYSTIEAMKNGVIFSNKYSSKTKTHGIPIIVCFMNRRPLAKKFSNDRYQLVVLNHSKDVTDNEITYTIEDWRSADFDEVA